MKRQGGNDDPPHKDAYCEAYQKYLSKKNSTIRFKMPEQYRSIHGYNPSICKDDWTPGFNF